MKKPKYLLIGVLIIIVIIIFAFSQGDINLKAKCCTECKNAFSKSPIGVGPEMARCGEFSTAQPLSDECKNYFEKNYITVSECK